MSRVGPSYTQQAAADYIMSIHSELNTIENTINFIRNISPPLSLQSYTVERIPPAHISVMSKHIATHRPMYQTAYMRCVVCLTNLGSMSENDLTRFSPNMLKVRNAVASRALILSLGIFLESSELPYIRTTVETIRRNS